MKILEINSSSNETFKKLKSLLTSKGIKKENQFFLIGKKLIDEFLFSPQSKFKIEHFVIFDATSAHSTHKNILLSKELFKELDILGTHQPLLVLSYQSFIETSINAPPQGLELVCPLGDPRNLGALIRSAFGLGAKKMILTNESAHPFLPQSVKSSAGVVLKMDFQVTPLKLNEIPVTGENYVLDLRGENIKNVLWPKNLRLWVGEEGPGVQLSSNQEKNIKKVNIPTPHIESLNAMISTTIALWEWNKSNN